MRVLFVSIAIAAGLWLVLVGALALAGRRTAARELATLIPNLVLLFKDLLRDPAVPRRSKIFLALAAAWIASPIDLIPEFVPVLGPLDDAIVAALALRSLIKRAGPDVVRAHWRGAPETLDRMLKAHNSE